LPQNRAVLLEEGSSINVNESEFPTERHKPFPFEQVSTVSADEDKDINVETLGERPATKPSAQF
jgi:hypothetical protein